MLRKWLSQLQSQLPTQVQARVALVYGASHSIVDEVF
jgi:hypothetical protein